jgi:hypothetical protein
MIAKRIKAAFAGRAFWLKLKKEYDIDNGVYVLLMPEDDPELNELALLHIDDLVNHRKARGIIILTDQQQVMDAEQAHSDSILKLIEMTGSEIDNLLSFFELYAFTERLLIVSLTRPYGSKLYNTLGIQGVTKEDLVCLCIFLIRDWTSAERV